MTHDGPEARAFLDAHPDIEAIQLAITDASGVARGKKIAREELTSLYAQGRNVEGSILGLDITGEDVEATGLVWAVGDADQCCRPVPGTLHRAPRVDAYGLGRLGDLAPMFDDVYAIHSASSSTSSSRSSSRNAKSSGHSSAIATASGIWTPPEDAT
jgi:glutamine synthetase